MKKSHSFGKCARRILEVPLAKTLLLRFIALNFVTQLYLLKNTAKVSQYVIAKIWLKRNYISESY